MKHGVLGMASAHGILTSIFGFGPRGCAGAPLTAGILPRLPADIAIHNALIGDDMLCDSQITERDPARTLPKLPAV